MYSYTCRAIHLKNGCILFFFISLYKYYITNMFAWRISASHANIMTRQMLILKQNIEKCINFNEENMAAWNHDDVIKWKHISRNWPFVRGIHRGPVNSPHKGQWREAFVFSLICVWINGWVKNREAGDLRRYRAHYDITVMLIAPLFVVSILVLSLDYFWTF